MNFLEYIEKNKVSRSAFGLECKMSVSMLSRILKATKGKVKIDVFNR